MTIFTLIWIVVLAIGLRGKLLWVVPAGYVYDCIFAPLAMGVAVGVAPARSLLSVTGPSFYVYDKAAAAAAMMFITSFLVMTTQVRAFAAHSPPALPLPCACPAGAGAGPCPPALHAAPSAPFCLACTRLLLRHADVCRQGGIRGQRRSTWP